MKINNEIRKKIREALKEDIKTGDITTDFFVNSNQKFTAVMKAKSDCVLAGAEIAKETFKMLDNKCAVNISAKDGSNLKKGDIILKVEGGRKILSAERTALNFVQRMSGIATKTRTFVNLAKNKIKILDTRKTAPGLRIFDKYSVKAGGGINHRFGLFDAFMIKDNHISCVNNHEKLSVLIKKAKTKHKKKLLEIEAANFKQAAFFSKTKVDVIMLDNMPFFLAKKCIKEIRKNNPHIKIELSGGIDRKNFSNCLKLKADFVSLGTLTHSIKAADIALKIKIKEK